VIPLLVLWHGLQEAVDVLAEIVDVCQQFVGGAFTGGEADGFGVFVDGDEINFRPGTVPVSLNAAGQREIADAESAAFFVKLSDQFFEGVAFGFGQSSVGLGQQFRDGSEGHGSDRIGEC